MLLSTPILHGIKITLLLTGLSAIGGILIGSCIVALSMANNKALRLCAKIYVNLIRATPLVLILLGFFLVFPPLFGSNQRLISALIAFILFEAAYFTKIIRAGIVGISQDQQYASEMLGLNSYQTYRLVILPQAIRAMLPVMLLQIIIIFQDTSIVYIIGLNDFFTSAYNQGQVADQLTFYLLTAGLVYWLISILVTSLVMASIKYRYRGNDV